jgi:D-glycero-D-manno-heptose 1,7-bisphosphate phosphatase
LALFGFPSEAADPVNEVVKMSERKKRAVFLDRDGVLNQSDLQDGKPHAPRCLAAFQLLPDARSSVQALHEAGLTLVVVTNQPDVGNGLVHKDIVEEMHDYLRSCMPLDAIKVCYHKQAADCACRKPEPALLFEASEEMDINLKESFMVGDRWSDIVAGRSAGCFTIFINRDYTEPLREIPDATVTSLADAAKLILSKI